MDVQEAVSLPVSWAFQRDQATPVAEPEGLFAAPFAPGHVANVTTSVTDSANNRASCRTVVSVLHARSIRPEPLETHQHASNVRLEVRFNVTGRTNMGPLHYEVHEHAGTNLTAAGFRVQLRTAHTTYSPLAGGVDVAQEFPDSLTLEAAAPPTAGNYSFALVVEDAAGARALIDNAALQLLVKDCGEGACLNGRCDPGDPPHDGAYTCVCNEGFRAISNGRACERITNGLKDTEIRQGGQVFACGAGTRPSKQDLNAQGEPRSCVLNATTPTACQAAVASRGERIELTCPAAGDALATQQATTLATVLDVADGLDLGGQTVAHLDRVGQAAVDAGARAARLKQLGLADCQLRSWFSIWGLLQDLQANTSQVVLDVSRNPRLTLPAVITRPLAGLRASANMVPRPLARRAADDAELEPLAPCFSSQFADAENPGVFELCPSSGSGACQSCPAGHYAQPQGDGSVVCQACAAGGYFQDGSGWIGTSSHCACRECPAGTYSETPGAASVGACQKCPTGTEPSLNAGYRACRCLAGHFRRGRFAACEPCGTDVSIECTNDVRTLNAGHWWGFASREAEAAYTAFVADLRLEESASNLAYAGYFPQPYECPNADACLGGDNASCATGYTGVLCSQCVEGYFDYLGDCKECPSKGEAIVAAIFIVLLLLLIFGYLLRQNFMEHRRELDDEEEEAAVQRARPQSSSSLTKHLASAAATLDTVMTRIDGNPIVTKAKIVLSFLQVASSLRESFSSVVWPTNFRAFLGAFRFLNINPFAMVMPVCLVASWHLDAYADFVVMLLLPTACVLLIGIYAALRHPPRAQADDYGDFMAGCWRNVFFFVFLFYPSMALNTFRLLRPCTPVCLDTDQTDCTEYLDSDYSIECRGSRYDAFYAAAAVVAAVVACGIPLALLVVLVYERRVQKQVPAGPGATPFQRGLAFFYESYSNNCYLWEAGEMVRKLLLTSVIIFIGEDSFTQLTVGVLLCIVALCLHAQLRPFPDGQDYWLQYISLSALTASLLIGIALRGQQSESEQADDEAAAARDNEGLGVLLILCCIACFVWLILYAAWRLRQLYRARRRQRMRVAAPDLGPGPLAPANFMFSNPVYSSTRGPDGDLTA